ncbi:MAG: hypothetical protein PF904_05750 [Kiritimatiellae bacterium]|nr:hypothetical protein [Kiritimatiellia bacterium]
MQVGDHVVRANDKALTGAKRVMALMVNGGGVSFKDITLYSSESEAF